MDEQMVNIVRDEKWHVNLEEVLEQKTEYHTWTLFKMQYELTRQLLVPEFKGLRALDYLPDLKLYSYQIEAAETVIEKMNGKAILADEVGLGKTIEAGLILKEYMIRGLVQKAIILAPASLVNQWVEELRTKFHVPAIAYRKNMALASLQIVVMSLDMAKRSPHKEQIIDDCFDLIIIDEAHKLKNARTQNYQFVQQLKKKFCLLLTATPIQNHIFELYHLISLLKPGHLGNEKSFKKMFSVAKTDEEAERFIHELVNQVMIRNERKNTELDWTSRQVQVVPVTFSSEERIVYEQLLSLQDEVKQLENAFTMLTLQKELCSSKEATALTLMRLRKKCVDPDEQQALETMMEAVMRLSHHAKAEKVYDIIQEHEGKVLIFTEYEASQLYLQNMLMKKGITSVPFNGRFSKSKRDWMQQLFKEKVQVLIATESGSEGINLQFCNVVINYDLPWNPMKLEQRIGRVHRIGQTEQVHVYNLVIQETIEDHILQVLYEKIGLFENVIGELDDILSKVNQKNVYD